MDSSSLPFAHGFKCFSWIQVFFLPETIFQGLLALKQDLVGVVRFIVCVSWADHDVDEKEEENQDGV